MVNDIGTIKNNVLPQTAQTSPTASVGRPEADNRARTGSTQASRPAKEAEKDEPLEEMVSDLNKLARDLHRELQFSVDDDSGETVIKVVDRETKEVLRQIPSEEIVQLRKRLEEAAGVLFHSSA